MDWSGLDAEISSLDAQVTSALSSRGDWKAIWERIRQIGATFRDTFYPTREQKAEAWSRYQNIIQRVKDQQVEARQRWEDATRKAAQLDQEIAALEALVSSVGEGGGQWRSVWDEIKRIGEEFKQIRYPSRDTRDASWKRFQSICDSTKTLQSAARKQREDFERRSENHKYEILACANNAMPINALEDMVYTLSGLRLLETAVTAAVNLLPGPDADPWKNELEARSRQLAEGRRLLSTYKTEMRKKDKDEAWVALNRAAELLERDWAAWKEAMRQAHQANQQARERKQQEWQERVRQRIAGLEEQLHKLESAEARTEGNIDKLREMEYPARTDAHRDRVRGWLSEAETKLRDI